MDGSELEELELLADAHGSLHPALVAWLMMGTTLGIKLDSRKAGADAVTVCDVFDSPTRTEHGEVQCGFLQAHWGYGSIHDGDRYEVRLCEGCFFMTLAYLKQEYRIQRLFDEVSSQASDSIGLVASNDVER